MWQTIQLFIDCAAESSTLGLGDRDALNLGLLAGYALATGLAAVVLRRQPFPDRTRRREKAIWIIALVILAILTVNKELDLQNLLTKTGRCVAHHQGWYADRRAFQRAFSLYVLAGSAVFGVLTFLLLMGTWSRSALPFLGIALLFCFIGLRVVSFHHVDHIFRTELYSVRLHRIVEASGLILIILGEALLLRKRPVKPA